MINGARLADREGVDRYLNEFLPSLRCALMAEWPAPGKVQEFASQPSQAPDHQVVRFYLQRQGHGDRVPATLWLPARKTRVRGAVLLVHPNGAQSFENRGEPVAFVGDLLKHGCSVLIPDTFNTGRTAFVRAENPAFFTTYNRTDDANRIQDVLTSLAYLRDQAGNLPITVIGYENAGLWCYFARALATDDASYAIDLDHFEAGHDEAYLKTLNIPGILRAGDVRTAGISNSRGRLWLQNPGQSFPSQWLSSAFKAMEKGTLLRIDDQPASASAMTEWILQSLPAAQKP